MDRKELQVIEQLMEDLKDQMEYGEDDFAERLGRKKPGIEVVKIEGEIPMEDEDEIEMPKDEFEDEHERLVDVLRSPSHKDDMDEADEQEMELEDEISPDDKLKKRLMKLRG